MNHLKTQFFTLGTIIVLFSIVLSGCIVEENKSTANTVTVPVNTLGLTVDDLPNNFVQVGEEYNTTAYVIEEGVLKGMRVIERYNMGFKQNESTFINLAMSRYESKDSCSQAFTKTIAEYRSNFQEVTSTNFGDESFFGEQVSDSSGSTITSSFLVFRIADVFVVLSTISSFDIDTGALGHIIENNMKNNLA
jgi:hypothetical protein